MEDFSCVCSVKALLVSMCNTTDLRVCTAKYQFFVKFGFAYIYICKWVLPWPDLTLTSCFGFLGKSRFLCRLN